ncbi:MAG: hypothetical protein FD174_4012 [Geobacteraceae bacterium]|nr:MAG: hypothetical protein FD174_4012 [Geobacteraceae bacterium]
MFGWFKKEAELHVFESNLAAFEYACEHLENRPLLEAVIPAMVEEKGKVGDEGEQYFRLRLAGKGGGRELWACTLKEATDYPEVGDLVGFKVVKVASDLPEEANIIGFIAFTLEPVLAEKKGWRIAKSYVPQNIRPTVRF